MQSLPIGEKVNTELGVFEIIDYDNVEDIYFCYQQGFYGHSGTTPFGEKYLNTKYDGNCWWFKKSELVLSEDKKVPKLDKQPKFKDGDKVVCISSDIGLVIEEGQVYTVKRLLNEYNRNYVELEDIKKKHSYDATRFDLYLEKAKLNYREMSPTQLIKISIDGKEAEVPLVDLVSLQALVGRSTGEYKNDFYNFLFKSLGGVDLSSVSGDIIHFSSQQKQALDYFFKPYYDKQQQEKDELKTLIEVKMEEVDALVKQLNQLNQM